MLEIKNKKNAFSYKKNAYFHVKHAFHSVKWGVGVAYPLFVYCLILSTRMSDHVSCVPSGLYTVTTGID